ncbi:MAG: sigma-54-dependent Fis family transcriptional regulator [Candidatus Riflebacteria bacterium]|nr:sigma-54-dependent Fis family transcriptional regulator [Candidatus Riflebacteria bacterium]
MSARRTATPKDAPAPEPAPVPPAAVVGNRPAVRLLVVDDQPEVVRLVSEVATGQGLAVESHGDADSALAAVKKDPTAFSLAILDYDLGRRKKNGLELLGDLRRVAPDLRVVMLSGEGTIPLTVAAMRAGASAWIEKNFDLSDNLEVNLRRLLENRPLQDELAVARERNRELSERVDFYQEEFYKKYRVVGQSAAIKEVLTQVERLAPIPRPVLIFGERGTGKELVAAAIHRASPRRSGPFVTLNCSALSEGLLECELFGQEENAFNNAPFRRGRFELAHKGTLFLDEIGNMPHDFQQKILRVLEYQAFERVGGGTTVKVDVRVVAATNADLEKEMKAGKFREDLYDRLAFESVRLPPLRERLEDIPPLAAHFLRVISAEVPGIEPQGFEPEAERLLASYDWPGNIRELKFYVERVGYRTRGAIIRVEDLPPFRESAAQAAEASLGSFHERVAQFQRKLIQEALTRCSGDRARAASSLSLSEEEFASFAGGSGPAS